MTYFGLGVTALILMMAALRYLPCEKSCAPDAVPDRSKALSAPRSADTRREFWTLFLFQGVITGFSMFRQHFSTFHRAAGFSEGTLGWALWLSMAAAALGAVLLGSLTRSFGAARSGAAALTLGAVSFLCFLRAGNTEMFLLAAALHGAASSAIGIVIPAMAREVFSEIDYGRRLSRVMVASPVCTLLFMQLFAFSFDHFGTYAPGLAAALTSLFLTLFLWTHAFSRFTRAARHRGGA